MPILQFYGLPKQRVVDYYNQLTEICQIIGANSKNVFFVAHDHDQTAILNSQKTAYVTVEWIQRLTKEQLLVDHIQNFFKNDVEKVVVFFTDVNQKLYLDGKKLVSMKIGNIEIHGKVVQGPMAGVSNQTFRLISKKHGASLVYAEMVSIEGILHNNQKTHKMLEVHPQEHPMAIQIFGSDVESFVKATKIMDQTNADIIDLNLGCPAPKIAIKSQSGSQLLKTPELIYEIVQAVVANTKKPVTAKIRLGWDKESVNAIQVAKLIEKAGASAIAVHGRTRSDFYSGHADWEKIKEVKQAVKIPVIGNGDVVDEISAQKMLEQTGCDAVMISRASQGNPWIFKRIHHFLETGEKLAPPTFSEWKATVYEHAELLIKLKGENLGMREFRKHLAWYLDVLPKKPIVSQLKQATNEIEKLVDIKAIINQYEKE